MHASPSVAAPIAAPISCCSSPLPIIVRTASFAAWRAFVDELAPLLSNATQHGAPVVWRTTMPILEHAYRNAAGSTYFVQGHFQARAACIPAAAVLSTRGWPCRMQQPCRAQQPRPAPLRSRLQNEARRVLFDSYAEWRLRSAGGRVWDIAAFAGAGSYRPKDMVREARRRTAVGRRPAARVARAWAAGFHPACVWNHPAPQFHMDGRTMRDLNLDMAEQITC